MRAVAARTADRPRLAPEHRLHDCGAAPPSASAAERWIRAFVCLYLEVEAGLRPARHLRPLMLPDMQPLAAECGRPGRIPEVLSVRVQARPGVCEAVVLLQEADRVAALAVAVRRDDQGWRIAEVRRPDGTRRPDPPQPEVLLAVLTWHEITNADAGPGWVVPSGWQRQAAAARAA